MFDLVSNIEISFLGMVVFNAIYVFIAVIGYRKKDNVIYSMSGSVGFTAGIFTFEYISAKFGILVPAASFISMVLLVNVGIFAVFTSWQLVREKYYPGGFLPFVMLINIVSSYWGYNVVRGTWTGFWPSTAHVGLYGVLLAVSAVIILADKNKLRERPHSVSKKLFVSGGLGQALFAVSAPFALVSTLIGVASSLLVFAFMLLYCIGIIVYIRGD